MNALQQRDLVRPEPVVGVEHRGFISALLGLRTVEVGRRTLTEADQFAQLTHPLPRDVHILSRQRDELAVEHRLQVGLRYIQRHGLFCARQRESVGLLGVLRGPYPRVGH